MRTGQRPASSNTDRLPGAFANVNLRRGSLERGTKRTTNRIPNSSTRTTLNLRGGNLNKERAQQRKSETLNLKRGWVPREEEDEDGAQACLLQHLPSPEPKKSLTAHLLVELLSSTKGKTHP